jgi:hypothetical protein
MALKRPGLPTLTIGLTLVIVVAVSQADRVERHLFIPLFAVFIGVAAIVFNQAMTRIVRRHLQDARRELPE